MSGRKRNPRRVMLEMLTDIRKKTDLLRGWWDITGKIYDETVMNLRARRPDEYPEAQLNYWAATVADLDQILAEIDTARTFAYQEWDRLRVAQSQEPQKEDAK